MDNKILNLLKNKINWTDIVAYRRKFWLNVWTLCGELVFGVILIVIPLVFYGMHQLDYALMVTLTVIGGVLIAICIAHLYLFLLRTLGKNYRAVISDPNWNEVYRVMFESQMNSEYRYQKLEINKILSRGERRQLWNPEPNKIFFTHQDTTFSYYDQDLHVHKSYGKTQSDYFIDHKFLEFHLSANNKGMNIHVLRRNLITKKKRREAAQGIIAFDKLFKFKNGDLTQLKQVFDESIEMRLINFMGSKSDFYSLEIAEGVVKILFKSKNDMRPHSSELIQFHLKGKTLEKLCSNIEQKMQKDIASIQMLLAAKRQLID